MLEAAASMTLGQALRATAARVPDRAALLSDASQLSWAELDAEVDRVVSVFAAAGVGEGSVVGFMINKRPEVVTGFLACARLGAVMAPINFKLHIDHVQDQVRTAGIGVLVAEPGFDRIVAKAKAGLSGPARVVYVGDGGAHDDLNWAMAAPAPGALAADDPDRPCYYNYTSGTTGRPKGAVTTHRQIQVNAVSTIQGMGFEETDIFLGMFSVFAHPHELFHRSIVCGGPFVILDTLSPRLIARAVERFKVTWMMAVPSFYEMMLDHASMGPDGVDLSSLRVLESGGAFVGAETLERMESAFAGTFTPVWGCTEATGVALANGPGPGRRPGATGRAIPGYDVRVVDERGRPVPTGDVGEMLIRGPAVVEGYIHNVEETTALFADGWYHTRDLVWMDEDGFVFFVGRRSEMLKIGGIRVYPLEIEKALMSHPDVTGAVVVRAEERVRGEVARAVVSTARGSTLTVRQLQAWCRGRLAVYKVPRIVEFWAEVPKMPNGKIDKKAVLAVPPDPTRDER